jgi:hypothetical protein
MAIVTKDRGKYIEVTDDAFAMIKEMQGQAFAAGRMSRGGEYRAFASDSMYREWGDAKTAQEFNSELELRTIAFCIKEWRAAIARVNEYMDSHIHSTKVMKSKVYGVTLEEEPAETKEKTAKQ